MKKTLFTLILLAGLITGLKAENPPDEGMWLPMFVERLNYVDMQKMGLKLTPQEIYDITMAAFPGAKINFVPDKKRQGIVDTWPADTDDSSARHDWGWQPDYDQTRAFEEYLIPSIRKQYNPE